MVALPQGEVAMLRREGRGGTLVFAHANGLNKSAYGPMFEALGIGEALVAFDARGHGRTELPAPPSRLRSWTLYADDLIAALAALDPEPPVTLVGHSMGAVSALLAVAGGAPVSRLVMIEPVIVPDAARLAARTPFLGAAMPRLLPIARRPARRRDGWPDPAAAREAFARSRFFGAWHEAALAGYLRDGLRPDGETVRLACDPAWEAASFAAQAHRFWGPLRRVAQRGVPVHALHVDQGSTVPRAAPGRLARAGVAVARAHGDHLLPLHRPRDAAAFLRLAARGGGA